MLQVLQQSYTQNGTPDLTKKLDFHVRSSGVSSSPYESQEGVAEPPDAGGVAGTQVNNGVG